MLAEEALPPRRILYVITDLQIGGVPLHLRRLAPAMQKLGHEVRVVSLAPPGPVSADIADAGVPVASCDAQSSWSLPALWRLRCEMMSFKPDIVHSFLFHANIACRLLAPLADVAPHKLICEIQTVEIERRWHLSVDRWTHRLCRLEIGNSPSVVEHLHLEAGLPRSKLALVPGGVDVDEFDCAAPLDKSVLGVAEDSRLLLWVGRLDPVKGLDVLLRGMPEIVGQVPVHLLLVGEGPERSRLEYLIRELGLADHVTLLGARRNVPRLMKTCDVFILPSYTEGMSNSLLEAMAAGRPIVCTDIAGNRDLVSDGESGLTVMPGDPEALARAVLKVLKDPELADRIAARAKTVVREKFDRKMVVDRYLEVYGQA